MKFLTALVIGLLSLSTSHAIRIRDRLQLQEQTAVDDSMTFTAPYGAIAAYGGHVYFTTPPKTGSTIRYLTPESTPGKPTIVKGLALTQVSYDGSTLCGTNAQQQIICSRSSPVRGTSDVIDWVQLSGVPVTQVVIKGSRLVIVSTAGQIFYTNYDSMNGRLTSGWTPMTGQVFSQISFSGDSMCGCTFGGQIWCQDIGFVSNPQWRMLPGSATQVVVEGSTIAMVNSGGVILQAPYARGILTLNWSQTAGSLNQIAIDPVEKRIWGINNQGQVLSSPMVPWTTWA